MKNEAWPTFSFTESLSPPDGWRTDCAILSTYSADLVVVVNALLALTGCDLDNRRVGSRVELVKAIETLSGKVCVLTQSGRVAIPNTPRPILKLLDKFVKTVNADEKFSSWHPKAALVRYHSLEDPTDHQWRIWVGSRNLTRAINWETGLILTSRSDRKGQTIDGLAAMGRALAARAQLANFSAYEIGTQLAKLTWECPPGSNVHSLDFIGPGLTKGFPKPSPDTERVFIVSPFLDATTVHAASQWGGAKTRRTLVSTAMEIQRLLFEADTVFSGFDDLRIQPFPDLLAEGADIRAQEDTNAVKSAEGEESEPAGLHAKLIYAARGARRQLWLGSANATARGWQGHNFEIVAEISIGRYAANAVEEFIASCERFNPRAARPETDEDENALEGARKLLTGQWSLRQRFADDELEIFASAPPPLSDSTIEVQVAVLGGQWTTWQRNLNRILLAGLRRWQRSDFLQIRLLRGDRMCAWVQIAPCDPPPDDERDHALIAQYLDPHTFLLWLRSLLNDEPARAAGGDWDAEGSPPTILTTSASQIAGIGLVPTVEEILRAWAQDSSAFIAADERVKTYLGEIERRADENGAASAVEMLRAFRRTWDSLASELR